MTLTPFLEAMEKGRRGDTEPRLLVLQAGISSSAADLGACVVVQKASASTRPSLPSLGSPSSQTDATLTRPPFSQFFNLLPRLPVSSCVLCTQPSPTTAAFSFRDRRVGTIQRLAPALLLPTTHQQAST